VKALQESVKANTRFDSELGLIVHAHRLKNMNYIKPQTAYRYVDIQRLKVNEEEEEEKERGRRRSSKF
jgi:hypothetical protein